VAPSIARNVERFVIRTLRIAVAVPVAYIAYGVAVSGSEGPFNKPLAEVSLSALAGGFIALGIGGLLGWLALFIGFGEGPNDRR
jgi:hypothetical protein